MRLYPLLIALALLALVPTVRADEISGYVTTLRVTDEDKHTASTDSDVTYIRYNFAFSADAPKPNAADPADRVGYAWLLLNVDHHYHNGRIIQWNAIEDNEITYRIIFNGMVIEYRTELHVEDTAWNPKGLLDAIIKKEGERGHVRLRYLVYDQTGNLVADETETQKILFFSPESIPDSRLWVKFENNTLTVQPDFLALGLAPRIIQIPPTDTTGRVQIFNVTYESLELEVISAKTLEDVSLGFGFARPGNLPHYTFGSFVSDVVRSVAGTIGTLAAEVFEWVLLFIPGGDKLLIIKEYIVLITNALWEILVFEPLLFLRVLVIMTLGYGIILFIDPMFGLMFRPFWWLLKAFWVLLTWLWDLGTKAVGFISHRIPGGGGG